MIEEQIRDILESFDFKFERIKPSEWAEKYRVMTSDVSPYPGKFSYSLTPYLREVIDCLDPNESVSRVVVMKGAQIGYSTGVIEPGVGWIMKENPGNILFFVGHADLVPKAMDKIDQMIDSCGIRDLIRPNTFRRKNQKTGDTNTSKEFPGGYMMLGSPGNHKSIRQLSARYGFFDDYESIQGSTKQSGDTKSMIEQRFAAYEDKMKLFYISTPELEQTSNIEPLYLHGDQRRWFVPCPVCDEYQTLEWEVKNADGKKVGGIVWEVDEKNRLIEGTVGYKCSHCEGTFEDKHKFKMNKRGEWRSTAKAKQSRFRSYHISALYAPPGFKNWQSYVQDWLDAHPKDQEPDEAKLQSFYNLCLGKTWKARGKGIQSNALQKNQGRYELGVVPDHLTEKDGNGRIFAVTCGIDLNGTLEDARVDYEVVAWSENGSSYSVTHGSIGTFESRKGAKGREREREKWTYYHNYPMSVWPELEKILDAEISSESGREYFITAGAVDVGNYTKLAYDFLDVYRGIPLFGFKGDGKVRKANSNDPHVRKMRERSGCYLVNVNLLKDELHACTLLKWDERNGNNQPDGFMNFPFGVGKTYSYKQYFQHFEAEQKVINKNARGEETGWEWRKKTDSAQNHLFDCRVYAIGVLRLMEYEICKEAGVTNDTWEYFVNSI